MQLLHRGELAGGLLLEEQQGLLLALYAELSTPPSRPCATDLYSISRQASCLPWQAEHLTKKSLGTIHVPVVGHHDHLSVLAWLNMNEPEPEGIPKSVKTEGFLHYVLCRHVEFQQSFSTTLVPL